MSNDALLAPIFRVALVQDGEVTTDRDPITNAFEVARISRELLKDADREHFLVFLLDGKNRLIGVNTVSVGCLNSAVVHPREVYKPAVLSNACSVIAVHNHPSGDPSPSDMDLDMFRRLRAAGEILGIDLLDAIVVTSGGRHHSAFEHGAFTA